MLVLKHVGTINKEHCDKLSIRFAFVSSLYVKIFAFMDEPSSLPFSHQLAICAYPKPNFHSTLEDHFNNILPGRISAKENFMFMVPCTADLY